MARPARHGLALPWSVRVSVARKWEPYIGKPFEENARGPHAFDCWGLARAIYKDLHGIDLPSYGEIDAADLLAVARTMAGAEVADPWHLVASPAECDIALMRSPRGGRAIIHVGVMVDAGNVLHTQRASHSVIVPIDHYSVSGRIAGFRRHRLLVERDAA